MIRKMLLSSFFALIPALSFALPFNQDMVGGQLEAGSIMRPNPSDSIARGAGERFVGTREEAGKLANPVPADARSIGNGRRLFSANCSPCHGKYMDGKHIAGAVSAQIPGPDLALQTYKDKPDGHFFEFIHFGGIAIMPAYGWKFSIREHWDIVNYIRRVQQGN
jgi:mono/diheme cytochrome c family protein